VKYSGGLNHRRSMDQTAKNNNKDIAVNFHGREQLLINSRCDKNDDFWFKNYKHALRSIIQ